MDPSKSEGVSRQSSILKPTKQRQPLQCVAPNPGSSESSPTIKIKRRVSFARNKRIREFCNEAEQGTVWDDTYEEHDSSGAKSNSTGGNEPLTITVPCHDKENFPVQLFLQTDQIECKEVQLNAPGQDAEDNLSQCDMEMDVTLNNLNGQNKDAENATIYCDDDGMEMTTFLPSGIIACHNQDTEFLDNREPTMELVGNLAPCKNSTAHHGDKTELLRNNAVNSTDLTVAISQLLAAGHANKQSSDLNKYPNMSCTTENTAAMEFTSVLPSSTWIRPNSLCNGDKRTENLDNQTMEFTMAVPQTNIRENHDVPKTDDFAGKTQNFANKSMEMTEAIPVQRIIQAGVNNENVAPDMIDTETIAARSTIKSVEKISNERLQDKTKIFVDQSVEITKPISAFIEKCKETQSEMQQEFANDKTQMFANRSIEMTEAIPAYIQNRDEVQSKIPSELIQNKTTIFDNQPVEVTEAISVYIDNCDQAASKTPFKAGGNKTQVFANTSMEMTEAISNYNQNNDKQENTNVLLDKSGMEMAEAVCIPDIIHRQNRPIVERTPNNTIFVDKSMEVTGPIPAFYKFHHSNYGNIPNEIAADKTNIYANKSMEMTEAIPSYKSTQAQANDENLLPLQSKERTNIFANVSMEMTESVPQTRLERTKVFPDTSMEMTEAVPARKIYQSDLQTMPGRTKVFADTSMEMTEAVNVRNFEQYREIRPREETKIILNESMEMTEAVPNLKEIQRLTENQVPVYNTDYESNSNTNKILRKSLPRRKSVYDKPTEITGMLASLATKDMAVPQHERTEFFANDSMNVTETIPVPQNIISNLRSRQVPDADIVAEKTRMFANDSMNVSETGPIERNVSVLKHSAIPDVTDKTRFFHNKSMEMTEAIPGRPDALGLDKSNLNPRQEKTKIFLDKSMDMTETIAISNKYASTEQGKNMSHGGPHFASSNRMSLISKASTIPNVNSDVDYFKSSENVASSQPTSTGTITVHRDDSMEMTAGLPATRATKTTYNSNENKGMLDRESSRSGNLFGAGDTNSSRSDRLTSRANERGADVSAKLTNSMLQPNDPTKIFANASMELTAVTPVASSAPGNVSRKTRDLSHNQSILSSRMDPAQNPINVSNFDREDMFHRITSDELNSLCASMNLPYQNYCVDNNSVQNSSVPACSNVSLLRESLRNGTLFQQKDVLPVQTPTKTIALSNMDISEMRPNLSNFDISRTNILAKSSSNHLMAMDTDKTAEIDLGRMPMTEMELDKTPEINRPRSGVERQRLPSLPMDTDRIVDINLQSMQQPLRSRNEPTGRNEVALAKLPINASHFNMDISMAQECPPTSTAAAIGLHNSITIAEKNNPKNVCTVVTDSKLTINEKPGTVEIYRDVSMEIGSPAPIAHGKRKSDETCESVAKRNPTLLASATTAVCTYTQAPGNPAKDCAHDNSLSRLPSDSTEVLLATMGFKTELAYPLIINDKTTIKVSQKAPIDRTYVVDADSGLERPVEKIDKTYVVDGQKNAENQAEKNDKTYVVAVDEAVDDRAETENQPENKDEDEEDEVEEEGRVQESENEALPMGIPIVKSPGRRRPTEAEQFEMDELDEDKENKEPRVKVNLYVEKYSTEIEEIQPPSFLSSASMHDDDLSDIVKLPDDDDDDQPDNNEVVDDNVFVPFAELSYIENVSNNKPAPAAEKIEVRPAEVPNLVSENIKALRKKRQELLEELKMLSKNELSRKDAESHKTTSSKKEDDEVDNEPVVACENESMAKEPLSPFEQLTEDMRAFEKRDFCIWSIRMINSKLIVIDFVSKSLVLIIRLKEVESIDCMKDIEKIELVSRLPAETKNTLLKTVHNLLLSKLNPSKMLDKYKMYEDILPLLEFVSSEVIFAMNFMFDLERLNALNLLNIDERSIVFMVASRKANIILKISLTLKLFNEITPDDIDVVCVLGDVRISDIKQLIVHIKRDNKFLSRYIKDVKDYITLMEESSLHKF